MAAGLVSTIEEAEEEFDKERFVAGGGFYDAVDMAERYKGKPEQLDSIFKNSRKITCPIRNVELWQDPGYQASPRKHTNNPNTPDKDSHQQKDQSTLRCRTRPPEQLRAPVLKSTTGRARDGQLVFEVAEAIHPAGALLARQIDINVFQFVGTGPHGLDISFRDRASLNCQFYFDSEGLVIRYCKLYSSARWPDFVGVHPTY